VKHYLVLEALRLLDGIGLAADDHFSQGRKDLWVGGGSFGVGTNLHGPADAMGTGYPSQADEVGWVILPFTQ
jgi:hypothetical protein